MNDHERMQLERVLDTLIPPSADGRMPGAGQLGLAEDLGARPELAGILEAVLGAVERTAGAAGVAHLEAASWEERRAILEALQEAEPALFAGLLSQSLVAYYQRREVLIGLGGEGRPPFPLGYEVAATDFCILDGVRARAPFYRAP